MCCQWRWRTSFRGGKGERDGGKIVVGGPRTIFGKRTSEDGRPRYPLFPRRRSRSRWWEEEDPVVWDWESGDLDPLFDYLLVIEIVIEPCIKTTNRKIQEILSEILREKKKQNNLV